MAEVIREVAPPAMTGEARGRAAGDRGAGVLLVLVAVALVATMGLAVVRGVEALAVRHQVNIAADLAAVAGANAWLGDRLTASAPGPRPQRWACVVAARVATANQARLRRCVAVEGVVQVQTERVVRWWGIAIPVRGQARAGPVTAGPAPSGGSQPTAASRGRLPCPDPARSTSSRRTAAALSRG